MTRRPDDTRLGTLVTWFAASVLVTAGVIYSLKLQEDRRRPRPERTLPRATPAQEPLTWQHSRRRGRPRPVGPRAVANSLARLEGHFRPDLS